ncbi:MAG: hypothetical protein HC802_07140, partial [Caldilineaceae bacterium]|nr:hypothetical protein [Caldilineaceae bacterium]
MKDMVSFGRHDTPPSPLLGRPQFERDGHPLHFRRRRALALAIYLAVTEVPHTRESLTTLFWPETNASEGRANLRRMLYALTQVLGQPFLVTQDDLVCLNRRVDLWTDLLEFRRLLAACQQHGHAADEVCPDCLVLLTQAADLYQGEFLAGFSLPDSPEFDRWQFFQGEQLRAEMALTLALLARGHTDQGQFLQATVYAQRRLALDPLDEDAHRHLMQIYAWSDQPAAAERQYRLCADMLRHELDAPPSAQTEELRANVLRRQHAHPAQSELHGIPSTDRSIQDDFRPLTVVSVSLASDEETANLSSRTDQIRALVDMAQSIAARYGGHVEHVIGEEVVVVFGRDQVHEDDAERGVRTALALLQAMVGQGVPLADWH